MDLAIRFPTLGRIHLESRFLFSEPQQLNCRQFLERVFQAPEITQVTIKSRAGSSEVPRAELGYCPRTYTLRQVVDRVTASLCPREPWTGEVHVPHANGLNGSHGPNGQAAASSPASSNGHASCNGNGQLIAFTRGTIGCNDDLGHSRARFAG